MRFPYCFEGVVTKLQMHSCRRSLGELDVSLVAGAPHFIMSATVGFISPLGAPVCFLGAVMALPAVLASEACYGHK